MCSLMCRRFVTYVFASEGHSELVTLLIFQVTLIREDRKLSLSVDSSEPATIKLPKKINAGNVLYIGGLPEKGALLPNSLVRVYFFIRGSNSIFSTSCELV